MWHVVCDMRYMDRFDVETLYIFLERPYIQKQLLQLHLLAHPNSPTDPTNNPNESPAQGLDRGHEGSRGTIRGLYGLLG